MKLNEVYNYRERFVPTSMLRFGVDVFGKKLLTPHEEMADCVRLFETEPIVNSGITQMKQFIMGNEIAIESKDSKTQTFFEKWIDQRVDWLDNEIGNFVQTGLITGNMAMDVDRDERNCITRFRNVNDTSRIFKNIDEFGRMYDEKKYCFYEVTPTSGIPNAEYFQYSYLGYRNIGIRRIFGVPIPKKNIVLGQMGWSRMPIYGRSFLASALEDATILRQIKMAFAVIAKYKAVPRKIVSFGAKDDNVSPEELVELQAQMQDTERGDNMAVNKPVNIQDMSFAGQDVNLDPALQYVWKSTISGLAPAYLVGFATDTNRATSAEIKVPFGLRIEEMRKVMINVLNRNILQDYFKAYPWLSRDATFKFGEVSMDSTEQKIEQDGAGWERGTVSFNEYRKAMGKQSTEGGDIYKWQLDMRVGQIAKASATSTTPVGSNTIPPIGTKDARPELELPRISKSVRAPMADSLSDLNPNYKKVVENLCANFVRKSAHIKEGYADRKANEKNEKEANKTIMGNAEQLAKALVSQTELCVEPTKMGSSKKQDYVEYAKFETKLFLTSCEGMKNYEGLVMRLKESLLK